MLAMHTHSCGHDCTCRMATEERCLSCDIQRFEDEAARFLDTSEQLARSGSAAARAVVRRVARDIDAAIANKAGDS